MFSIRTDANDNAQDAGEGRRDVAKVVPRGGPLFSRSEVRLPAESRPLGSLESRRTSSSRHTAPG
jgi:hypothetical protein